MALEEIFPGICLTLSEHLWSPENIRAHGFTHIIRIDRHMARKQQQQQTSRRREHAAKPADTDLNANVVSVADDAVEVDGLDDGGAVEANDDHLYAGFKTLDLNFGEDGVYLSTVLPNCYKGVTFIEAALRGGGAVLIIDRLSKQKSVTVVIGFLMYKHHIKFSTAFQRVKQIHPNLELHGFYQTQLHEYEPILQVQRTQSYGNSCSRELRCTQSKRKLSSMFDDCCPPMAATSPGPASPASASSTSSNASSSYTSTSSLMSSTSSFGGSDPNVAMFPVLRPRLSVIRDSTCPADILME